MDPKTHRTAAGFFLALVLSTAPSWAQCADESFKLLASDGTVEDSFGSAVALSGTTALIGMPGDDDLGTTSGSAYLFDTSTGAQVAKLLPSDGSGQDHFGFSVAVDGTTAVVGALLNDDLGNASGSVYLFDTTTGNELMKLLASDGEFADRFGFSVALEGTTVVVGAAYDDTSETDGGSAYVFDANTGLELHKLVPAVDDNHDYFGWSVALSGPLAVIGAPGDDTNGYQSGAAYVFDRTTGAQLAKLLPDDGAVRDGFGSSVAISRATIVVGSPQFFPATTGSGAAYLFDANTGDQLAKLQPDDGAALDAFGYAVGVEANTVVIGSLLDDDLGDGSGSVYMFDAISSVQTAKIQASDGFTFDQFGSVAISGTTAIVGAYGDDDLGPGSGSAYVFDLTPLGTNFCAATSNSTGEPATLFACGSASLAADDLSLTAEPVPNEFALFFYGGSQVQVPFGDGFRCAGGTTTRLHPPVMGSGSLVTRSVDLSTAGIVHAGMLHFQCWYRDPAANGAGFNLSDGLSISFVP